MRSARNVPTSISRVSHARGSGCRTTVPHITRATIGLGRRWTITLLPVPIGTASATRRPCSVATATAAATALPTTDVFTASNVTNHSHTPDRHEHSCRSLRARSSALPLLLVQADVAKSTCRTLARDDERASRVAPPSLLQFAQRRTRAPTFGSAGGRAEAALGAFDGALRRCTRKAAAWGRTRIEWLCIVVVIIGRGDGRPARWPDRGLRRRGDPCDGGDAGLPLEDRLLWRRQ